MNADEARDVLYGAEKVQVLEPKLWDAMADLIVNGGDQIHRLGRHEDQPAILLGGGVSASGDTAPLIRYLRADA